MNAEPDLTIIEAAREAHRLACQRRGDALAAMRDAEERARSADAERQALIRRAAAGDAASIKQVHAVEEKLRLAQSEAHFQRDAATHLETEIQARDAELMQAQRDAWVPVVRAGAMKRIEAARDVMDAKTALRNAEAAYAEGTAVINEALGRGVNVPPDIARVMVSGVGLPVHGTAEREAAMWVMWPGLLDTSITLAAE